MPKPTKAEHGILNRLFRRPPGSGKTRDNPATSNDAYKEIAKELSASRARVYFALLEDGPSAAWEIEAALGTSGLWRRFSELERAGLIERTGEIRRRTITGKACCVYRVVPAERVEMCAEAMKAGAAELREAREIAEKILEYDHPRIPPRQRTLADVTWEELFILSRAVQKRVK